MRLEDCSWKYLLWHHFWLTVKQGKSPGGAGTSALLLAWETKAEATNPGEPREVMASSCTRGGPGWVLGKIYSQEERLGAGTAAQGVVGRCSWGVPELWGCGTEGRGQWAWSVG